jgi:hypothetical protein
MNKLKIFLIFLISLGFNTYGLWWSVNIDKKGWISTEQLKSIETILISSWQEIYSYDKSTHRPLGSALFYEDSYIKVKINQEVFSYKRHVYDWMRSCLWRSLHPDEHLTLRVFANMHPNKLDFDPKVYHYGGCYVYTIGISFLLAKLLGFIQLKKDINFYLHNPKEIGKIYIVGRLIGAILAGLSVIFIYLAGCNLFSKRVGIFAGLFFSSCPAVAVFSHYMQPYPHALFWLSLCLYLFSLTYKNPKLKFYILAGLAQGAALGTLIMSGAYLILCCILYFLRKSKFKEIFVYIISCFLAFFLTNPYVLINPVKLLNDLSIVTLHHPFQPSFSHFFIYFYYSMPTALSWFMWLFCLISIGYSLFKFKKNIMQFIIGIFLLLSIFYTASMSWSFIHYGIWYFPALFLSLGIFTDNLLSKRKYLLFVIILLFTWVFLYTLAHVRLFGKKDARIEAAEWIRTNIPQSTSIGGLYKFHTTTPFINPFLYKLVSYKDKDCKYLVVSSLTQYNHHLGIIRFDEAKDLSYYIDIPLDEFKLVKVFHNQPKLFFLKFKPTKIIPSDWLFLNPWVFILQRKESS